VTDWKKILSVAASEAQRACEVAIEGGDRARHVGIGAAGDRTLVADREAERAIVDILLQQDDTRVLSEEAGERGPKQAGRLAIVDPLDGSSNFSRGIPFYCTSICIVEGANIRNAYAAIVRNLVTGDVYYAERGKGASKNGAKMRPSATSELTDCVAAIDLSKASIQVIERMGKLSSKVGRQVHFGANALEMCMAADGQVDTFVDLRGKMRITDAAGSYLIGKEAGITITSEAGGEIDPPLDLSARMNVVATSNRVLHSKVLAELSSFTERRL
jgi:myo-inositol-1(or 4)-monophosphatase